VNPLVDLIFKALEEKDSTCVYASYSGTYKSLAFNRCLRVLSANGIIPTQKTEDSEIVLQNNSKILFLDHGQLRNLDKEQYTGVVIDEVWP